MNDAVLKAASEAAAKEIYKQRCKSIGVPVTAWGKVDAKVKEGLVEEAMASLSAQPPPDAQVPEEPSSPQAPAANGMRGQARVDPTANGGYEDFKPEHKHVVLDVVRGNLRRPLLIPAATLAPDVTSVMPEVLRNVISGMLLAQQTTPAGVVTSEPVQPNRSYCIQDANGTRYREGDRIDYGNFTGTWEHEGRLLPCLQVRLVDDSQAMMSAAPTPTGGLMGNPVVIGTEEQAGQVLGFGVAGGQQAAQPAPQPSGSRDQGAARLA